VAKITFELGKDELPADLKVESVHLVGEFNDWETAATPMKRNKKGAYRATIDLEPGQSYQFRYLVNNKNWCNDWNADLYVPGNFGEDNCVVMTPNG
jgi:1,4-alpha-glucan branching enzyme